MKVQKLIENAQTDLQETKSPILFTGEHIFGNFEDEYDEEKVLEFMNSGQFFVPEKTLPKMDHLKNVVMGIEIPTEEEMSALPDPEPMDTTDPLQLNESQPAPLKFDEDAMDWSYLEPASLTKEMNNRHGLAHWVEGQDGKMQLAYFINPTLNNPEALRFLWFINGAINVYNNAGNLCIPFGLLEARDEPWDTLRRFMAGISGPTPKHKDSFLNMCQDAVRKVPKGACLEKLKDAERISKLFKDYKKILYEYRNSMLSVKQNQILSD